MSQCLYLWMPIFISGSAIRCTCSQKVVQWGEPWIRSLQQIKPRDNLAVACKKLTVYRLPEHVTFMLTSCFTLVSDCKQKENYCGSQLYEIAYGFCLSFASQHPVKQFQILLLMLKNLVPSLYCVQILNDAHTSYKFV